MIAGWPEWLRDFVDVYGMGHLSYNPVLTKAACWALAPSDLLDSLFSIVFGTS